MNDHYALEICPGFWDCLIFYNHENQVFSIDPVYREITVNDRDDNLVQWLRDKKLGEEFFLPIESATVHSTYEEICQWVELQKNYRDFAIVEFFESADSWLIAYAKQKNYIVVTHELPSPFSEKVVKIPDVCANYMVPCVDPFTMLKALNIQFEWSPEQQ